MYVTFFSNEREREKEREKKRENRARKVEEIWRINTKRKERGVN